MEAIGSVEGQREDRQRWAGPPAVLGMVDAVAALFSGRLVAPGAAVAIDGSRQDETALSHFRPLWQ